MPEIARTTVLPPPIARTIFLTPQQGPPGRDGAEQILTVTAASALSGHRVVTIYGGQADYPDLATDYNTRLGITTHAAAQGAEIAVILSGPLTEPSWNWVEGPVWAGPNGTLTQTPPPTGPMIRLGNSLGPQVLAVSIQPPIVR